MPILMSDQKAAQVASVNLYGAWLSREAFQWTSDRSYALLDPSDVVTVQKGGLSWQVRITKRTEGANGVVQWEGVQEDSSMYTQFGAYSATNAGMQSLSIPSSTALKVLDTYSLRDSDTYNPQVYLAASGYGSNWSGAYVYESRDGGVTYQVSDEAFFTNSTPIGSTTTAMAAPDSFGMFDEISTVTVQLFDPNNTLSNATEAQVLLGANAAYVGGEIIQFKNAEMLGAGMYKLSGLLRGRRGSEKYATAHEIGEDFVFLNSSTMQRDSFDKTYLNSDILFKPLSTGSNSLSSAPAKSITFVGNNMKPLAPVFIKGYNDATGSWTLEWVRRTRRGGEWLDGTDAELGEESESYLVEIWDAGFENLKRSISAMTQTVQYSDTDQITDFAAVQQSLAVRIYQMSSAVGHGEPFHGYIYVGQASIDEKFYALHDMIHRLNPRGYFTFENIGGVYEFPSSNHVVNMFPRSSDWDSAGAFIAQVVGASASQFNQFIDDKPCGSFDGVDDSAGFVTGMVPIASEGYSTLAVLKPNATQQASAGIWTSSINSSLTNQYVLRQSASVVSSISLFSASATTQSSIVAATAITTGAWNFISTTHAAGTAGTLTAAKIYKDGVSVASGSIYAPTVASRNNNGVMRNHYSNEYGGLLSVFANWRRELTETEMRRLKSAYEFGARPKELVFASSRHSVSDRCGMSSLASSGISVETNTGTYGFKKWWRATGDYPVLTYGPSQSYVIGSGDFELEMIIEGGALNAAGELQCLIDFGVVKGDRTSFNDNYPEEFNEVVRNDGFCLFLGKKIANIAYPVVTDTALLLGAQNTVAHGTGQLSTQYPQALTDGKVYAISVYRRGGVLGTTILCDNNPFFYQPEISFSGALTADRFTLFNFNPENGAGNWPFKGKVMSVRFWNGISFNKGLYTAI
jgi:hypothetical protein